MNTFSTCKHVIWYILICTIIFACTKNYNYILGDAKEKYWKVHNQDMVYCFRIDGKWRLFFIDPYIGLERYMDDDFIEGCWNIMDDNKLLLDNRAYNVIDISANTMVLEYDNRIDTLVCIDYNSVIKENKTGPLGYAYGDTIDGGNFRFWLTKSRKKGNMTYCYFDDEGKYLEFEKYSDGHYYRLPIYGFTRPSSHKWRMEVNDSIRIGLTLWCIDTNQFDRIVLKRNINTETDANTKTHYVSKILYRIENDEIPKEIRRRW